MLRNLSVSLLPKANMGRKPAPARGSALRPRGSSVTLQRKGLETGTGLGLAAAQAFHKEPLKTPGRVCAVV